MQKGSIQLRAQWKIYWFRAFELSQRDNRKVMRGIDKEEEWPIKWKYILVAETCKQQLKYISLCFLF